MLFDRPLQRFDALQHPLGASSSRSASDRLPRSWSCARRGIPLGRPVTAFPGWFIVICKLNTAAAVPFALDPLPMVQL
jgi:hypothetical protein